MASSASLHHQETLESILVSAKPHQEKKPRPADQQALKCPRCDSINTKFCYYNNYSLSQPRYFCKSCRRYWTKGGTLRNVPVGGGYRKNKRASSFSSSKRSQDHQVTAATAPATTHTIQSFPPVPYDPTLAVSAFQKQSEFDMGIWGVPSLCDLGIWADPNLPIGDVVLGMNMNCSSLFYGGMPGNQEAGTPFEAPNLQR